jgi:tetratricopeptide (TPR) repeat protein
VEHEHRSVLARAAELGAAGRALEAQRRHAAAADVGDRASVLVVLSAVVVLGLLSVWKAPHVQAAETVNARSLGELAEHYRGAGREDALTTVALWTQREVEAETQGLLEAVEAAALGEDATPGGATLLAAAGLLGDSALRALHRGNRRRTRWELQAAARLVSGARSTGDVSGFARGFYLVAGLMLHAMGDLAGAYEMLSEGRRHAEDDAELLLALGAVSETIAALREYELPEGARGRRDSRDGARFAIEGNAGEGGRLPRVTLSDAQALYAKALRQDPDLLEARLRIGRVLVLRDQPREALPELERVWRESPRSAQYYMARLFEGHARERLGDPQGAATAYSAAADRVPQAQCALVALGRALDRLGEGTRAQEAFDRAIRLRAQARNDPWWDYLGGQPDRIDGLFEELRRLVP